MAETLKLKDRKAESKLSRRDLKRELRASIKRDALENDRGYYGFIFAMVTGSLPITLVLGAVTAYAIGYGTGTDLRWLGLMPVALQGAVVPHTSAIVYGWRLKRGLVSHGGGSSTDLGELRAESIEEEKAL